MTSTEAGATTALAYIADYRQRALDRRLEQYRGKDGIAALLGALALGAQTLEDEQFNVLQSWLLDAASGDRLDKIGAWVGEARGALADRDYRIFIRARVLVNISDGSVDALIRIVQALDPTGVVRYHPLYPACYSLQLVHDRAWPEAVRRRAGRLIDDARPGGVGMEVIEAVSGYFGFDGDPSAEAFNVGIWSRVVYPLA